MQETNKLNYKLLELARESRGLTQTELAEKIGIPQGNLSRMERGEVGIKDELLNKFSEVLNYPQHFFFQDKRISNSDTHYRKAIAIEQRTKLKSEALMNIYKFNIEEMLKSLDVKTNIPVLSSQIDSPEKAAKYLRSYWKVDRGPIVNLVKLIEDNGIIVLFIDFETDKIEGRSLVTDTGHPLIFINKHSSGDRQRLTIAHELGHVILHLNVMPFFATDEETEAFAFACEFLMPYSECQYDLTSKTTIEKLVDLKRYWKVSIQSMVFRMNRTGIITSNRYRYLWSIIIAKGWKTAEPIPLTTDPPTLTNRMAQMMIVGLKYTQDEVAKVFCLNKAEMEDRYFKAPQRLRVA